VINEAYLKQAKSRAAKYCAGRERSPYQVLQKLFAWELDEDNAQQVLAELIAENFIDEERFARAFCHDKFEFNQWGKIRIRQELSQHRIAENMIQIGLNSIDPAKYEEVIFKLAVKKWSLLKDDPWIKKQKTTAFLVRKGFEMDLAIEAVRKVSAGIH